MTAAPLSASEARRMALAAQGLKPRRVGTAAPDARRLVATIARLGLLQIDSVNVLVRAHYLPLFSRLGAYDPALLDQAAWANPHRLFEYWGHEASLLPVSLQPLLRWRMARALRFDGVYGRMAATVRARPDLPARLLAEIAARGALGARALEVAVQPGGTRPPAGWWAWSEVKCVLEWLFWSGQVTTGGRRGFERLYDLPERVLPPAILARPTPTEADAQRELLRLAARALGVATAGDLADYFRLPTRSAQARLAELVEAGALMPVTVEGWSQPAFADPEAPCPARPPAIATLLSPFDPLIWARDRTERLFGFRYRLEIYTPAARRRHGYYVLPFLVGDRLAARVDLKADRPARVLRVLAAHGEADTDAGAVAALAPCLTRLATWLNLDQVTVAAIGDLAPRLATEPGMTPDS